MSLSLCLCVFVYFNLQPPCSKLSNWVPAHRAQTRGRGARHLQEYFLTKKTPTYWCLHKTFILMFQHLWFRKIFCMESKEKHKHQSSYKLFNLSGMVTFCMIHQCNGGTKLFGVTNQYLIYIKAHSMKYNQYPTLRETCERRGRKHVESRQKGGHQRNKT